MGSALHRGIATISDRVLQALSRKTSAQHLIREIDGLRLLAIAGVIATHSVTFLLKYARDPEQVAQTGLYHWAHAGHVGVQLFFAISGFILALPFARAMFSGKAPPKLSQYYLRRVGRIEPPFLINLTIFYVLLSLGRHGFEQMLPHFLASCAYMHNWIYGVPSLINGVAWSLEVEIQFYILAPFLANVFRIPSKVLRRGLLVTVIVGTGAFGQMAGPAHGLSLGTEICHFLVGFLMADVFLLEGMQSSPPDSTLYDILGFGSLVAMLGITQAYDVHRLLVPPLLFATMASAFRGRLFSQMLRNRWVYTLGGICYSTYLYHYWLLTIAGWATLKVIPASIPFAARFGIVLLTAVPAIFIGSGIMYVTTEKPFMTTDWMSRVRNWFSRTPTLDEAVPASTTSVTDAGRKAA